MKYRTVQTMMLPDCAEENYGLYYQGTGGIQVQQGEKKSLSVPENEKADLFTYFNGFYPKQWSQYAQLDGLRIKVTVSGNCRVLLCHIDGSRTVVDEEKEMDDDGSDGACTYDDVWNYSICVRKRGCGRSNRGYMAGCLRTDQDSSQ